MPEFLQFEPSKTADRKRKLGFSLAVLLAAGSIVAQGHSTAANQLPRSVVALNCDADVSFCRALVEELAQQHPGHIYRINPDPIPHNSFSIRVELESNFGQLIWKNGAGERVSAESHNYVEFAKYIIARANPQLEQALNKALHDAD